MMLGVNNQEGVAMMHEVSALECPGELSQLSFLLFFMLFFLHASIPSWPPPFLHLRDVVLLLFPFPWCDLSSSHFLWRDDSISFPICLDVLAFLCYFTRCVLLSLFVSFYI